MYPETVFEMDAAWELLAPGGYLVGDDYIEKLAALKLHAEREKKGPKYKIMKRKAADSLASRDPWRD